MCSLWTILDNNLKCIPPSMCKITYPQQTQLTGAFYERGRAFISSCVKSNLWEYEHICLWIIEQIFWNNTAFALSNMARQKRHWPEMGVRVWKLNGRLSSNTSIPVLTMHQSFNQFKFSWIYRGCLNWPQCGFMITGSCVMPYCDFPFADASHIVNSERCTLHTYCIYMWGKCILVPSIGIKSRSW